MYCAMWLLYVTIVFYSFVDAIQTKMLIDMGAVEANPILAYLIVETKTIYSIFVVKIVWLISLFVLLISNQRKRKRS